MKRIILPLFCIVILLSSCGKKDNAAILNKKITEAVELQFANEQIDSLKVHSIDTLSSLGYANLVIEMLERMKYDIEYQYKEAIFTGDEALINDIEINMMDIDDALDTYRDCLKRESTKMDDLLLYIVSVSKYKDGTESLTLLFTPDFKPYVLDPFEDNLLEKKEAVAQK